MSTAPMAPATPIAQQYIRMILSRWRLVFGLVISCTLGAWLFSVLVLANKPTFDAAARLNIVPTSEELGYANRFVRGSTFDGGGVLLQTYAEFAHTRPVVEPIVDRYIDERAQKAGLSREEWIKQASVPNPFSPGAIISLLNYGSTPPAPLREQIIEAVIKYTLIESVEGTYLIRITVSWDDPQSAAWFANALSDAIILRASNAARASGGQLSSSLEGKLAAKKAELADVQARSRALKASIGVVDLNRQKQLLFEARVGEISQLTSDRASLKLNQGQVAGLQRETGGKLSPAQQQLEQSLAMERPRAAGMAAGISVREKRIADLDAQIAALGRSEDAVNTLDANAAALQAEVAALTERSSFTEIENLANAPRIQIIERAVPPLVRSSPKVLLNTALGFVAGCALAGCALLLLGPAPARRDPEEPDAQDDGAKGEPVEAERDTSEQLDPVVVPIREPIVTSPPTPQPARVMGTPRMADNLARKLEEPVSAMAEPDVAAPVALAPEPEVEPAPDPAPEPVARETGDPHVFGRILPKPSDGKAYSQTEQAVFTPAIATWLARALAADGRPLVIACDGSDREAQHLYRLIYSHLRGKGVKVSTFDATEELRVAVNNRQPGIKPLIFAGGLRESARVAIEVQGLDDVDVLVGALVAPGDDAIAHALQCRDNVRGMVRRPPYVIAISE